MRNVHEKCMARVLLAPHGPAELHLKPKSTQGQAAQSLSLMDAPDAPHFSTLRAHQQRAALH